MRVHPGMQVAPQLVAMGSHDQAHAAMVAQHATDSSSQPDSSPQIDSSPKVDSPHLTADAKGSTHSHSTRMNR
jgi:hypothetical protein